MAIFILLLELNNHGIWERNMRRLWPNAKSADIQLLQGAFIVLEQEPILCIEKPLIKMSEHCWEAGPETKTSQLFQLMLPSCWVVRHYSAALQCASVKLHRAGTGRIILVPNQTALIGHSLTWKERLVWV